MARGKNTDTGTGTSGTEGNGGEYVDPASAIGNGSSGNDSGDTGTIVRDSAGNVFDPSIHSGPDKRNSDGTFRRKRGRKSGSSNSHSNAKVSPDLAELVAILSTGMVMFHSAIAQGTNTPEMQLSPQEAESLASSGLTFLAQFDVKPNPKVTAGIIFASNVAAIYGTRYAAIRVRKAQERKEKEPGTAGVYSPEGEPQGTTTFTMDTSNLHNNNYMS